MITPSQLRDLPLSYFERKAAYFEKLATAERKAGAYALAQKNTNAAEAYRAAIARKKVNG